MLDESSDALSASVARLLPRSLRLGEPCLPGELLTVPPTKKQHPVPIVIGIIGAFKKPLRLPRWLKK